MDEHAYEARAYAMAVAEEVETLGRACADRIVVDLTSGERVRYSPYGTWVLWPHDDRPAYALAWHRRDRDELEGLWTPSNSTTQLTFYVLTGEVTDLPIDWESGYMVYQPSVTITLECRPYGYGDPITITGSATAGPLVTLDLPNVPGDVPAEARLIITESSSQSRRTVEWGAEYSATPRTD